MATDNLRYEPEDETILKLGPPMSVFENNDIIMYVMDDNILIRYKVCKKKKIDQTPIQQLYYDQGNKISVEDILNTIDKQINGNAKPVKQFMFYD